MPENSSANQIESKSYNHPQISVLLPVYNGETYLRETIESILNQTYDNFEFIIINDGSTDRTASIIKQYTDPRIRFYDQQNRGLSATLNRAIELAKGEYLARQDHDDISFPKRFEKQIAFLESHPSCGMVGTWAEILEVNKKTQRIHRHSAESPVLKFELLFDNPFVHSSMMIRKEVFETVGLYSTDPSRQPPEDYELWSRVARKFEVANIPEVLLVYREVSSSMSRVEASPIMERVVNISAENLAYALGQENPDLNVYNMAALAHGAYHRLSPVVNLAEIEHLYQTVVERFSVPISLQSNLLKETVGRHLHTIRSYYYKYRYGKVVGKALSFLDKLGV